MEGDFEKGLKQIDKSSISIHSLRMEGDIPATPSSYFFFISIHSLRMEGDAGSLSCRFSAGSISIHSLRMEGDLSAVFMTILSVISIHSLRMEGDAQRSSHTPDRRYFNPLPPHGGRPAFRLVFFSRLYFNPLPPHGGRPAPEREDLSTVVNFNPLPPHGGRQVYEW